VPYVSGKPIVEISIQLDQFMDYMSVERNTWIMAIGNVGGLQAFYAFICLAIVSYFTNIDYYTNIVK
jgi:hypothetical protein